MKTKTHRPSGPSFMWRRPQVDALIENLRAEGRTVVGPTVRDGAIVYDELRSTRDLPEGWTDEQEAGRYRLVPRKDGALFGYNVGPHSWKRYLYPSVEVLWRAKKTPDGFEVLDDDTEAPRYALLGVRACELAAMEVHERVFGGDEPANPRYAERRRDAFVVAVDCVSAGGTCFCTSMSTGPGAESGYDIAMVELLDDAGEARYVVRVGSERGQQVVDQIGAKPATRADEREALERVDAAAASMGRTLDTEGLPAFLQTQLDNPQWDDVATRCMSCTNCTLVCPTCFCCTVDDEISLDGAESSRVRRWDSCFTAGFTSIHGGTHRASTKSRYRQWLTHKLSTWHDQFGTSGCVGCGRCITWCPVGIDITAEVEAIRAKAEGQS